MTEPRESRPGTQPILILSLAGIALLVAGLLLPAVNIYSRNAPLNSLRYWDCWRTPAFLLLGIAAIVLYWCGARRFDLLWYPALLTIALVGAPLVVTIFDSFESRAWAKYIVVAEPGLRWPERYLAATGWLALVAGTICISTAAWLVRPPRWQRVLAFSGAGVLAAGSYLPMQLHRAHAINFWHHPAGFGLVVMAGLALLFAAIRKYQLLWIVVIGSIGFAVIPISDASQMIRRYRTLLEQRRVEILRDREIYKEQDSHDNLGRVMTASEKLDLQRKFDQQTKDELARAEFSMRQADPGHLYPLGIVVTSLGILMLVAVAIMDLQRRSPAKVEHNAIE